MTGGGPLGASFDPDRIAALRPPAGGGPVSGGPGSGGFAATRRTWSRAGVLTVAFLMVLYLIEFVDMAIDSSIDRTLGIEPREVDGLDGIAFAPLLHHGWDHLIGNTLPVLILGFLTLATGIRRGLAATAIVWIVAGVGTWLTGGENTVHVGASSLVFGWLTYLICRGWFARRIGQIVLGLAVLVLYGSLLWGVLPGQDGISWQGHLFGAMGGLFAGWVLSSDERRHRRQLNTGPLASPR
ncbi:rhomboid family intramembrane serine protease [Nocardia grenadensis]|uniref:rhomboid family intramembrane serine protease n=1 Tax=Nocardia grenadensis TaxID=931537 RepID=UPI0009FC94C3|nr:rhomboid family intramembrane serine protease [Nocardia grenadensis]